MKRDKWLYPIEITGSTRIYFSVVGGGNYNITLDQGVFYNYFGDEFIGYPSLLNMIAEKVFFISGVTVTFEGCTPLKSHAFSGGGLKFSTWPQPAYFATTNPNFNDKVKSWLGVDPDSPNDFTEFSDFTMGGVWLEPCHGISHKSTNRTKLQFEGPGHSNKTRLVNRWASYDWARFNYKWCPISTINEGYSDKKDYQDVAKLAVGDANNLWLDVWENGLSKGVPILVIPDTDGLDIGTDNYMVVEADGDYMSDFEKSINERSELARTYDIDLIVRVRS